MTTVADILKYIETIAPPYMAESWDNVGLLCGRREKAVGRILVALDPFSTVIDEAVEIGADLIVTHHPLIFAEELKAVNESTETGRCLLTLLENGTDKTRSARFWSSSTATPWSPGCMKFWAETATLWMCSPSTAICPALKAAPFRKCATKSTLWH